ncbi:MAG: hypothetical protein LBG15_09160 [Dysgonamonadaceae bacterium]|jgi:hypothetical protein|nr:hypothetical protein [Dysgonamonadaceae bacterium]
MKAKLIFLTFLLSNTCSCSKISVSTSQEKIADTTVVGKMILSEIGGSSYKEKEYFIVTGKDTSNFSCIFLENKNRGRISIKLDNSTNNKKFLNSVSDSVAIIQKTYKHSYYKTTYQQQINELNLILQKAAEDFDLSKLQYLSFELVYRGDLAIEVTNQYIKEIGTKVTNNYKRVGQIFLNSQLGIDLNLILKPHFISIEQISIEKLHFVTRKELYKMGTIETDSAQVPDKILNCFIYLKLKRFCEMKTSLISCSMTNRPVIFTNLGTIDLEEAKPDAWRELLKEYFLCVCITEGFKDRRIDELDISQAVYFDILRYSPEAFKEIKDYAKKFVETIEPSPIVDLGNKKAIVLSCMKKYKSKELDEFIKRMDKYMMRD